MDLVPPGTETPGTRPSLGRRMLAFLERPRHIPLDRLSPPTLLRIQRGIRTPTKVLILLECTTGILTGLVATACLIPQLRAQLVAAGLERPFDAALLIGGAATLAIAIVAYPLALFHEQIHRAWERLQRPLCGSCGQDRTTGASEPCPACGHEGSIAEPGEVPGGWASAALLVNPGMAVLPFVLVVVMVLTRAKATTLVSFVFLGYAILLVTFLVTCFVIHRLRLYLLGRSLERLDEELRALDQELQASLSESPQAEDEPQA